MTPIPVRTFNEAAELFGAAPNPKRFDELFALMGSGEHETPEDMLADCLKMADRMEGECYYDIVGPSVDLMVDGIDRDRLQDYFHLAAQFGEARMLSRVIAAVFRMRLLATQTEGQA